MKYLVVALVVGIATAAFLLLRPVAPAVAPVPATGPGTTVTPVQPVVLVQPATAPSVPAAPVVPIAPPVAEPVAPPPAPAADPVDVEAPPQPVEPAGLVEVRAIHTKLEDTLVTIDVQGGSLEEVRALLQEKTGVTIVIDPEAWSELGSSFKLTMSESEIQVDQVLEKLTRPYALEWVVEDGMVIIRP